MVAAWGSIDNFLGWLDKLKVSNLVPRSRVDQLVAAARTSGFKEGASHVIKDTQDHYNAIGMHVENSDIQGNRRYRAFSARLSLVGKGDQVSRRMKLPRSWSVLLVDADLCNRLTEFAESDGVWTYGCWTELAKAWFSAKVLDESLRSAHAGSYLKLILLKHLKHDFPAPVEDVMDRVSSIYGKLEASPSSDFWKNMAKKFPVEGFSQSLLAFYLSTRVDTRRQEGRHAPRRRRRRIVSEESSFSALAPSFPCLQTNEKNRRDCYFGSKEPNDCVLLSDMTKATEMLTNGKVYVGYGEVSRVRDHKLGTCTDTFSRRWQLSITVRAMLVKAKPFIRWEALPKTVPLPLRDWLDGKTILSHAFLSIIVSLSFDCRYYRSTPEAFNAVTTPFPFYWGWKAENKTNAKEALTLLVNEYNSLDQFSWEGHTWVPFAFLGLRDHSAGQKTKGNKCGGHFRCSNCLACWKGSVDRLWSFDHLASLERKSWAHVHRVLADYEGGRYDRLDKDKLEDVLAGVNPLYISPFLLDREGNLLESLPEGWPFERYRIASDTLHDIKGFLKDLMARLLLRPDFNAHAFYVLLDSHLHKNNLSEMMGCHWRLCFVKYEIILLPCVREGSPLEPLLAAFCKNWVEL